MELVCAAPSKEGVHLISLGPSSYRDWSMLTYVLSIRWHPISSRQAFKRSLHTIINHYQGLLGWRQQMASDMARPVKVPLMNSREVDVCWAYGLSQWVISRCLSWRCYWGLPRCICLDGPIREGWVSSFPVVRWMRQLRLKVSVKLSISHIGWPESLMLQSIGQGVTLPDEGLDEWWGW